MVLRRQILLTGLAATGLAATRRSLAIPVRGKQNATAERQAWFFLSAAEAAFLTAAVDVLIPADEDPSASEAGVVDYIDLQLATAWGEGDGLYMGGPFADGSPSQGYQLPFTPAQLYRHAIAALDSQLGGAGFAALSGDRKQQVLMALSEGDMNAGEVPGDVFFDHLWQNTLEGYFADPIYNGNRDLAGWKMIGFPGANAYYLTEIDRYNLNYERPPSGVAHQPGRGAPGAFTAADQRSAGG